MKKNSNVQLQSTHTVSSLHFPLLKKRKAWLALFVLFTFIMNSIAIPMPVRAAADDFTITKSVDKSEVFPGENFTYTINYANSNSDATNAVVTDVLPSNVVYVSSEGSTQVSSVEKTGTPGNEMVIFHFADPLPSGSTGILKITVKFPEGTTVGGAANAAINTAVISSDPIDDKISKTSNAVTVIPKVNVPDWSITKTKIIPVAVPAIGQPVTYQITVHGNSVVGGLNMENVVITDTIPTNATYVGSSDGGVYDPLTGIITFPVIATLGVGQTITRQVTLIYNDPVTIADTATNSASLTGTPLGESTPVSLGPVTVTHGFAAPNFAVGDFSKSARQENDRYSIGQEAVFSLGNIANTGNVPMDSFVVVDSIPDIITLNSVTAGSYNQAATVAISYQTNLTASYRAWTTLTNPSNQILLPSDLTEPLLTGEWVTQVRWEITGSTLTEGIVPGFCIQSPLTLKATVVDPASADITNNAAMTAYRGADTPIVKNASKTIYVIGQMPWLVPEKTVHTSGTSTYSTTTSANMKGILYFRLRIQNHPFATGNYIDPVAVDVLPSTLENITYTGYSLSSGSVVMSAPVVSAISGNRWVFNFTGVLTPGDYVDIFYTATIKDLTTVGLYENELYISTLDNAASYQNSPSEQLTDTTDWDSDTVMTDRFVKSVATFFVNFSGSLTSHKLMNASLTPAWVTTGSTLPGGIANYQITIANTGSNGPISNIVAIDQLPAIGDKTVLGGASRLSQWRPYLVNQITYKIYDTDGTTEISPAGAVIHVYYSTSGVVSTAELSSPISGVPDASWSLTPPADITTVQAVKFTFTGLGLEKDQKIVVEWPMRAPYDAPANLNAYNSFAYGATYLSYVNNVQVDTPFLPAEPNKVVFSVQDPAGHSFNIGDFVWEDSNKNGIQDAGENGINGVLVNLYDSSNNLVSFTRTGDSQGSLPGYYLFPEVPAADGYYLEFIYPQNYQITNYQTGGGANPATDSDIIAVSRTVVTDLGIAKYSVLTAPFNVATEDNLTIDAGLYQYASLGDKVWNDKNADGIQNAGEPGIADITVELLDGAGTLITSTTTDGSGLYLFANLDPGTYQVRFTNPSGNYKFSAPGIGSDRTIDSNGTAAGDELTATSGLITLTSGQVDRTVDQGMYLGRIGDFVFTDTNANGIWTSGEAGFAGVIVRLYTSAGVLVNTSASTTTANPNYLFDNLNPGVYYITVQPPVNAVITLMDVGANDAIDSDVSRATLRSADFTLARGERNLTIDVGLYYLASLGNLVWYDQNGDGTFNGSETGLSGVSVSLLNADGSTALYDDGTTVLAKTTNGSGIYSFTGLRPGDYKVKFDLPSAEYIFSPQNVGGAGANNNSDPNIVTGITNTITLASGTTNNNVDAGMHKGMIGDYVWQDMNANGIQNAGEPGMGAVTVDLYKVGSAGVFMTTTTAGNGYYSFTQLDAGEYYLQFTVGGVIWFATPQNAVGSTTLNDSNIDTTGLTSHITQYAGDINLSMDAGYYQKASVGDRIWNDINGDGVQDAGELGISNVKVTLTFPDSSTVFVLTDANGNYSFSNLIPGNYTVSIDPATLPLNYQQSFEKDGSRNGSVAVVLSSGSVITDVDFGYYVKSSIGDFVWQDTNANGIQDNGEPGLPGVTVSLYNNNGTEIATTTTDVNGNYLFENLLVGTYTVGITVPASWVISPYLAGSVSSLDSDVQSGTGISAGIAVLGGQNIRDVDAGLFQFAQIGDTVWYDLNGNGIQDELNSGAEGVTVDLLDSLGSIIASTTTDASGSYLFTNLVPGQYQIRFTSPTDYAFTVMNAPSSSDVNDSDPAYSTGLAPLMTVISGESNISVDAGLTKAGIEISKKLITSVYDPNLPLLDDASAMQGHDVTYIFQVINTGTTYLKNITITDTSLGINRTDMTLISGTEPLAPGTSLNFYYTSKISGDLLNTATTTGVPCTPDGTVLTEINNPTDQDSAQVRALASVGDRVWNDLNANGLQDSGEPGIANVKVTLTLSDNSTLVVLTDTDGKYIFSNLVPGTYTVTIDEATLPANVRQSFEQDGTNNGAVSVVLHDGSVVTNIDFGYYIPASVGDRIWDDTNGDGIQDPGEPGMANVKVTLTLPDGSTIFKITDANGNYLFTDIVPGSYVISVDAATLPVNAHSSYEVDGSQNGFVAITLISNDQITNVDFGYYVGASVGDFVWIDTNRDGIQQDTESGMANVTVRLYSGSGSLIGETKTDSSGKYMFSDLKPDVYYVIFVNPSNYIFSPANKGSNTVMDSNPDAAGRTAGFTLVSRSRNETVDAGLLHVTAVFGTFIDKDGKPVPGAVVVITDAAGTTIGTTTSDVNGAFIIHDIAPNQVITITVTKSGFTTMVLSISLADTDAAIGNQTLVKSIVKTGETNTKVSLGAAMLLLSGLVILGALRKKRKTKSE